MARLYSIGARVRRGFERLNDHWLGDLVGAISLFASGYIASGSTRPSIRRHELPPARPLPQSAGMRLTMWQSHRSRQRRPRNWACRNARSTGCSP